MSEAWRLANAGEAITARRKPARVLVVTPVGLEGRGGIDRLNFYLYDYLGQQGGAGRLSFIGSRGEWRGPFWLMTFAGALFRFIFACLFGGHDVVHIHVSTDGSALRKIAFSSAARLLRMPYLIQYHGMMSDEIERSRPLWLRALGVTARGAACVIVLGEAYRAAFERMGVHPDRICVIHNGIPDVGANAVIPRRESGAVRILFSGEVGERKGANLLVEALNALNDIRQDWTCTIAGNGDRAALEENISISGLYDRVTFTGWIGIERVHELMCDADIVVLPSRAEALPLSLIEGASAGAVLVASDAGAVRDIVVDGVNGVIVARDSVEIAVALRRLIADTALRQRMQLASREIYEDGFKVSIFASKMLNAYEKTRKG